MPVVIDWEARAEALRQSPGRAPTGAPPMPRMEPPPPPQMETTEPPPPPPPEQLELAADSVKVHFFGVADNNWNLGVNGIGIKKGTTGKDEFSFFDVAHHVCQDQKT